MANKISRQAVLSWWNRSLSCAEALFTILNRAAGVELEQEEQASHVLAGGLLSQGHACGMLWGSALAAGVRARKRHPNDSAAAAAALQVTARIMDEFSGLAGAVNCREIIGRDLTRASGKLAYVASGGAAACTRLALQWAPKAHELMEEGLAGFDPRKLAYPPLNCAAETMKRLAGPLGLDHTRVPVWVAGFAGGLGLKGNACGALAAGMFALAWNYYRTRSDKPRDSRFKALAQEFGLGKGFARQPSRLQDDFVSRFHTILCREIVGGRFASPDDHSAYLADGGCKELIEFVVERSGSF
jgi:hypothetical protein